MLGINPPAFASTQLLTISQIQKRWQCSESFVRKELAKGRIAYTKLGVNVRVTIEEVLRYESARTHRTNNSLTRMAV